MLSFETRPAIPRDRAAPIARGLWCWPVLVTGLALVLATISKGNARGAPEQPLTEYLLADTALGRFPVISLLLSSSFGLNALLYQIWLGYSVGVWGLVAQAA